MIPVTEYGLAKRSRNKTNDQVFNIDKCEQSHGSDFVRIPQPQGEYVL